MQITRIPYSETERLRLRGVVRLAGEIIANYWPMRNFITRNPLHGLEHLPFEEAVKQGEQILGAKGYLSGEIYREYLRSGKILPEQIDAPLRSLACDMYVTAGGERVTRLAVLRACMLAGLGGPVDPDEAVIQAAFDAAPDRAFLEALASRLGPVLKPTDLREQMRADADAARGALVRRVTPSAWCDQVLGTNITEQINGEMIKWCGAFLDEGQAPWPMPEREKGFYLAWKSLAALEWSPCGIPLSRRKIAALPEEPEAALFESLVTLDIPHDTWQEYLSLHLAALPGWIGFIKWRSDQSEYEWQQAYPADLIQYLAVRIWYVRELVEKACQEHLGIAGNVDAISAYLQRHPLEYYLRRARLAGRLPADYAAQVDRLRERNDSSVGQKDAWEELAERYAAQIGPRREEAVRRDGALRLRALAETLAIDPALFLETPPEDLKTLLDWVDAFPESEQGPIWLKALEVGYQEQLMSKLRGNLIDSNGPALDGHGPTPVRPQAQAVFCIDVRSEPFRRHLEAVGDYETFGFAGFFTVFIRYQGLGDHHETDQYPVIMKAKNLVRELPRPYQGRLLSRHLSGTQLLHMGHELLYSLKENVITPYVMVESVGWFYALPLIGKTVFTNGYRNLTAWFRRLFAPPVATSLTIDKLSRKEVEEMLASEQRSIIRRALQQQFADRNLNLSLERLEFLRRRAMDDIDPAPLVKGSVRPNALSPEEEAAFVEDLRTRYQINRRWSFARMEKITRTGFTLQEQLFTVETALRMMGLTKNFARLVLFCGHGSASENNPFEAALDCGACGGNSGKPNARVLAAMANKPLVREALAKNGIVIPPDTYFIAGEHNTTTDAVTLIDLEDLPQTHRMDLHRLMDDLEEAGHQTSLERCARFPEIESAPTPAQAAREVRRRSGDWSQVRPEWGLSGNAAFVIGGRRMTRRVDLEGRVFLQSYDPQEDPTGRLLEILMTGPQVVGQWISMEYYFSTVDNGVYGSGSKIYHNVVGRFGVMSGPQSDLRVGLPAQTVMKGERPYHEPMRLLSVIEAPRERIGAIIRRHKVLQEYYHNEWVHLIALDPGDKIFYRYLPSREWVPLKEARAIPQDEMFLAKEQNV
ncbi:MAG: DUF2309 domain-containing protein [Candidatus Manganitrophus sp.]|nr:DUF2309 domain-containing protein [Candidatus Manganitrophus sp.]WDT72104.1 MAG: DUF2309 domain-containing protein [Candidatus Manganitrophus sp.]